MKNTQYRQGDQGPITVEIAAAAFEARLSKPAKNPLRPGNSQGHFTRIVLRKFCDHLGPQTPLITIFRDLSRLQAAYDIIVNDRELSPSYRKKMAQVFNRFLRFTETCYGLSPVPAFIVREPKGNRAQIACPKPAVIAATMGAVVSNFPEILAFAILLVFCGLRCEEAYGVLEDLRSHLGKP